MNKKNITSLLLLVFFVLVEMPATAQRFDAAFFAGGNICQVDGDDASGYNYVGLRAGVGTSFPLSEDDSSPWRMVVEVAYAGKGAINSDGAGKISLRYVEVPVMVSYNMMDSRLRLAVGVAPAVKVGVGVTMSGMHQTDQEENYKPFDLLPFTAAVRYRFAKHLCLEGRYQYSLLSVYDGPGAYLLVPANHGAFNRLLSFGLSYQL